MVVIRMGVTPGEAQPAKEVTSKTMIPAVKRETHTGRFTAAIITQTDPAANRQAVSAFFRLFSASAGVSATA